MNLRIPESPSDMTPEWLRAALAEAGIDVRVASVSIDPEPLTSITSDVTRVRIEYEAGADAPQSLIWKRSALEPARRRAFAEGYEREVEFYREIAPRIATRVPHCYRTESGPDGAHVLLLEDLSGYETGDLERGMRVEHARTFAQEIAGLHAVRWGEPDPPSDQQVAGSGDAYAAHFDRSMEFLRGSLDDKAKTQVDRYGPRVVEWYRRLMSMPLTIIHGDAHAANVLFQPATDALAIVDWQGWRTGPAIADVARFTTLSLAPHVRRQAEEDVVAAYLEALSAHGIDYGFDQAMLDYRLASGWQWGWAVVFSRHAELWSQDTRRLMHVLVPRAVEALRDAARDGLLD